MNIWLASALALMVGGLGPALWIGARGEPIDRLVGLDLAAALCTLCLLLLAQGFGQSSYLIAPLVLAMLSFAGTLVFTRLLGRGV
ncbi:monovalent cation/H+ antiporter complex subunit F [Streptosporangium amethystogenes]|uniref:monovalent cation/H+ antiporter complex subunit F n=1 Tax=Streptosporangium amethystogenes TaxID=2002 RepID=UPI0037AE612A